MSNNEKLKAQLAAFLGNNKNSNSGQASLVVLEQGFEHLEPNERAANRSETLKKITKLIKDCGKEIHFQAVYEIVKYCEKLPMQNFTISSIVINQLDKSIGKDLSPDDIDLLSNWGNSLIDFGYGFENDEQRKNFTDIFGAQTEEFHQSLVIRAIGCGVLSLLPGEKQAPGGNDFNLVFSEGLLEACISIFAAQVYYYERNPSAKRPVSSVPLDLIQTILTGLKTTLSEGNNK